MEDTIRANARAMPEDRRAFIRSVLAVAVAAPLAISPAVAPAAGPVDPVFEAMKRHRAAVALFDDENRRDAASEAEEAARAVMLKSPTTIAGVGALLNYVMEEDCPPDNTYELAAALLNAPVFATEGRTA